MIWDAAVLGDAEKKKKKKEKKKTKRLSSSPYRRTLEKLGVQNGPYQEEKG